MTFTGAGVRVFNAPVYQQSEPVRNPPNHNRYGGIKAANIGPRKKINKRRCYSCSRYGHLARDCLAPRKPNRVRHPPSPSAPDDKMEVEEQVVVVEEP
ncbi:unnamed protein product [Macrosiphum euphorbiae]|uniref:CCHC-type domain-containing protein n=1 Tax=Macrosiphum euphorbiae TaxID=13131 RepID=A0AAV0XVH9_9HEMI|nr:unnamed protein product [Macrosiphum euphorbiae]